MVGTAYVKDKGDIMSKTKIVGVLMLVAAVVDVAVDVLDGNGFDLSGHFKAIIAGLGGAGLIFLRSGVQKAQDAITGKK